MQFQENTIEQLSEILKNCPNLEDNECFRMPLPKGNGPYAKAKRAETIYKDMNIALFFHFVAITMEDRKKSAIKDIASLYHHMGLTHYACEFLTQYRFVFGNQKKFENLFSRMLQQKVPSEKSLKKFLNFTQSTSLLTQELRKLF